ncbi:MAG: HAD hydrolase-like protein [bacterium]
MGPQSGSHSRSFGPPLCSPFHGLTELFTWAGQSQIKLGIFTSGSPHHIIRNFGVSLPVLGYTDLFRSQEGGIYERLQAFIARAKAVYGMPSFSIVTCEDVTKTKPDPEGILRLLDTLGISADEAVALGDHPFDMQAANSAHVHPIGISHGFGLPDDLTDAGAIRIVDDLASLPKLIEDHNNGSQILF